MLKVMITRPGSSNQSLSALLQSHGVQPYPLSLFDIVPDVITRAEIIAQCDLCIFTSQHAVDHGYPAIRNYLNPEATYCAVGATTASHLLIHAPQQRIVVPPQPQVESLLSLPLFSQQQHRIAIFRGANSPIPLETPLRAQGHSVQSFSTHHSEPADIAIEQLALLIIENIDTMVFTCTAAFDHLVRLSEQHVLPLPATHCVVASQRIADHISRCDPSLKILVAANAYDEAIVDCVLSLNTSSY